MLFTTKTYNILKWVAQIGLPAFASAVAALGFIWGWDVIEKVVASLVAIDTMLGILLGISTATYNKTEAAKADGTLRIDTTNPTDIYRFEMNVPLSELGDKKIVTLVVDTNATLKTEE
jgi:hypothetical protein